MKIAKPVDLIIYREGKVLLLKRNEEEDKERWSVPGGGMEEGESKEGALRREIKEELDCEIVKFDFFKEFEYKMKKRLVNASYFYGDIDGKVKLSKEHSEYAWFSFEEIKELDLAFNQKEVLEEFFEFIND
jgi:8-oxo-dGTP diphosphatase